MTHLTTLGVIAVQEIKLMAFCVSFIEMTK